MNFFSREIENHRNQDSADCEIVLMASRAVFGPILDYLRPTEKSLVCSWGGVLGHHGYTLKCVRSVQGRLGASWDYLGRLWGGSLGASSLSRVVLGYLASVFSHLECILGLNVNLPATKHIPCVILKHFSWISSYFDFCYT